MGTVRHELDLPAGPEEVWAALRDVGAVHEQLAPGFVVDTRVDGGDRLVTFVNGVVVRERIVAVDDGRRRLAYSVVESPLGLHHHHASFEVLSREGGSRLIWITDVLPEKAAATVADFMAEGVRVIGAAFENRLTPQRPRA
jgi:Polyketide cyclase / dehydrase and lipid transport